MGLACGRRRADFPFAVGAPMNPHMMNPQSVEDPNANLPPLPVLTPLNITPPIPDITAATIPVPLEASCTMWNQVNGWIAQNPYVAVGILILLGFLFWPKGKR